MSAMETKANLIDELGSLADVELYLQAVLRARPARAAEIMELEPGAILLATPQTGDQIEVYANGVLLGLAKATAVGDKLAVKIMEFAGEKPR